MSTKLDITSLPGGEGIGAIYRDAGVQMDNLCGPYWASVLLRANGWEASQEDVALAAGTLLPSTGDPSTWVPRGEAHRDRYLRAIPRTEDLEATGTSVAGLLSAASELSGDACRLLPIRGRSGGSIDAVALEELVGLLDRHPAWQAAPVLNLRVGLLWGTRLSFEAALAYLSGAEVEAPEPEWDVGHFVNVAGLARCEARSMMLLRDSYRSFGWNGYHLQPLEAVANAIRRDDGREGGCLLFVASDDASTIERELKEVGFDIGGWDNGTPHGGGGR